MEVISAWKTPYKGNSADLFAKVLKLTHRTASNNVAAYLSNHIPICQSSGMGKSRMVNEAAKQIFTIPICFWNDGGMKSPMEDTSARVELLKILEITDIVMREKAFINFFKVIFIKVKEHVLKMVKKVKISKKKKLSYTELAMYWRKYLEDEDASNRKEIFQATTNSHQTMLENGNLKTFKYVEQLQLAVKELNSQLTGITSENKPLILISLDEFDSLMSSEATNYSYSNHIDGYFTILKVLYSDHVPSVMITVMSTYGYVFDIAPTSRAFASALTIDNITLNPVFTELPFNVHVEPVSELQRLENICNMEFISKYGRPLFRAAYEHGRKDDLVTFARERLANGLVFDSASHRLGVFDDSDDKRSSNRLGIPNFETSTMQAGIAAFFNIRFLLYSETCRVVPPVNEQKQVASHFLTILCIPIHRLYMHCIHPPEPILAEAAAQLLEVPKNLGRIIEISNIIFDTILTGGNSRGTRGEYTARLILMAAHDRAVLQQTPASNAVSEGQLKYTRPVKLLDFLKSLLNENYHSTVLQMMPKRKPKASDIAENLETAFADAYVNFTHYMRVENDVKPDYQLAWKALVRSTAIQCYQTQEAVDIIIPILFSNPNGNGVLQEKSVSAILIQVKNRSTVKRVHLNADRIKFFPAGEYHPYITIIMELGQGDVEKEPLVSTVESNISMDLRDVGNTEDSRYHFTINGVKGVYEGINDTDAVNLENLLVVQNHNSDYPREEVKERERELKPELYEINNYAQEIKRGYRGY